MRRIIGATLANGEIRVGSKIGMERDISLKLEEDMLNEE